MVAQAVGIAEAFPVGLALADLYHRHDPSDWPQLLADGTLDPAMRVLAGAIPRHGRLVIGPMPEYMVDNVLTAMADGPFPPDEVINAFHCVASHVRFRDHEERFGGRHLLLRALANLAAWWSLHDLLFLSDAGTRWWTDPLGDDDLVAILGTVGGLLRHRVLECLEADHATRLRRRLRGEAVNTGLGEALLHRTLVGLILAVERNEIEPPLPALARLPAVPLDCIAAHPWPEGPRDDSLASESLAIRRSLYDGGEPDPAHALSAAGRLGAGMLGNEHAAFAGLSAAARLAVLRLLLGAGSDQRRKDDPDTATLAQAIRQSAGLAATDSQRSDGILHLWRKQPVPPDPLRAHLLDRAADLLSALNDGQRAPTLASLHSWDQSLTEDLQRTAIFGIEDVCRLSREETQILLRHLEKDVLVAALAGASNQVRAVFQAAMSERAWEMVEDYARTSTSLSPSARQRAQAKIVRELRSLRRNEMVGTG